MNFIKRNIYKLTLLSIGLFAPFFKILASLSPCPPGTVCNPINESNISDFILVILQGVIKIGIPIVALAIIYSGFLFVAAQGNSEKLKEAKRALMYSLIGAAILLGSWAIAQLISNTVLAL
jgi:hypothetical protein